MSTADEVYRYSASYQLSRDGQVIAQGESVPVTIDVENLTVSGSYGDVLVVPLRSVSSIWRRSHRVHVDLIHGEQLSLYHLGHHYDGFWRDLSALRNRVIISDSLMQEKVELAGTRARYRISGESPGEGECEARLYETALVLITDEEGVRRIPFGLVDGISDDGYSVTISTEYGDEVTLSHMGPRTEMFKRHLSGALNRLTEHTIESLGEMLTGTSPVLLSRLSGLLRDGRAARHSEIEAVAPGLFSEMEMQLDRLGSRDKYDYLRDISSSDEVFLGMKRGLMGDLTGDYLWFLIPMCGSPPGPGNAIAMEVVGSESRGSATYFFRITSRSEYAGLDEEELSRRVREAVMSINRCMLSINFRREPIYLSDERLVEPQYERYALAVASLPTLRQLRDAFIGRVIHRSPEGWRRDVMDLLTFNTSTRDEHARWRRSEPERGESQ